MARNIRKNATDHCRSFVSKTNVFNKIGINTIKLIKKRLKPFEYHSAHYTSTCVNARLLLKPNLVATLHSNFLMTTEFNNYTIHNNI